jgi:hypothetical protein
MRNCAYYVVVGNNLKNQRAEFTFYRTNAIAKAVRLMLVIIVVSLSLLI